tara:strand:+ start:202 stop:585 length:384 start_codon:yes stop_codon:yes gene_type:complete
MNYDKYSKTLDAIKEIAAIDAIKELYLEIVRLQAHNAALKTRCETLTNRVSVLRTEVAIAKGSKPKRLDSTSVNDADPWSKRMLEGLKGTDHESWLAHVLDGLESSDLDRRMAALRVLEQYEAGLPT